jgi:DNA-binding transcriptional ArsR family regulator
LIVAWGRPGGRPRSALDDAPPERDGHCQSRHAQGVDTVSMDMDYSDVIDANALKALGHPLRMRLLTFISERGEASPVEMSRALDHPLTTVSHHMRVLRDLGYVEVSRTRPRRGALEHYYRATAAPFLDDEHWGLLPAPARRRVAAQLFRQVFRDAAAAGQRGGLARPVPGCVDAPQTGRRQSRNAATHGARPVAVRSSDHAGRSSRFSISGSRSPPRHPKVRQAFRGPLDSPDRPTVDQLRGRSARGSANSRLRLRRFVTLAR